MKSVLILSFSPIARDPRVMRQVRLLEGSNRVTVAGFGSKPDGNAEFVAVAQRSMSLPAKLISALKLLLGLSESYYWNRTEVRSAMALLQEREFDLVIANDIAALPLALRLARDHPVLMDAHEYSPREFEENWWWQLLFGRYHHDLCRRYLQHAAAMVTVCQGIADEYARQYGVTAEVVQNAPMHQKLRPSTTESGQIRMVHHGAAVRSRHLEAMIDLMLHLDDRFTLDLMLVRSDESYFGELNTRAAADSRIRFVAPVPMPDICRALNRYDLGLYLLPPVNFNHAHALPNKFFEFIQARLGVAIGPSPEMARIVNAFDLGVVAPSFKPDALGAKLNALSESDVRRYKLASDAAATSLSFETSSRTLLQLVDRLLAQSTPVVGSMSAQTCVE